MTYQSPARIPDCHPEQKHKAHGKCDQCYNRDFSRSEIGKVKHRADVRRAEMKRKYGITEQQYNEMLESQKGLCAVCGNPQPAKKIKRLSIDHDHQTGRVRGLLCTKCNLGLGYLDNTEWMQAAKTYLKEA